MASDQVNVSENTIYFIFLVTSEIFPYTCSDQTEIIKKSVHYQLYPMYVLRSLEVALEKCSEAKKPDALKALDEAVAYYTGSEEGAAGNGTGSLLFVHARRRCGGTRTCGASGDQTTGNARVNIKVFADFTEMKAKLDIAD